MEVGTKVHFLVAEIDKISTRHGEVTSLKENGEYAEVVSEGKKHLLPVSVLRKEKWIRSSKS